MGPSTLTPSAEISMSSISLVESFRTVNICNVVFRPGPAVPQVSQSDTLLDGLLSLLECQLSSLETNISLIITTYTYIKPWSRRPSS